MDRQFLKNFLVIIEEKTLTQAAKKLNTSQSSLSRQIQKYEEKFKVRLFDRTSNTLCLTEDGKYFQYQAKKIIQLFDDTEIYFKNITPTQINIGTVETQSIETIIEIEKELLENKHSQFSLLNYPEEIIVKKVLEGELDFGVIFSEKHLKYFQHLKFPVADEWGILTSKINEFSTCDETKAIILPNQSSVSISIYQQLLEQTKQETILGWYSCLTEAIPFQKNRMARIVTNMKINQNFELIYFHNKIKAYPYLIWKKQSNQKNSVNVFLDKITEQFLKLKYEE